MRGEESSDSESGRMEESSVRRSLETLCQELNMDEQTATETMENFTAIWNTYTLEGEVVHWLACSLYAACRKGSTPTVGKGLMEGNCVSLTRILRTAKLRRLPCHISDVFKFCWTLFVYTKGNFSMIGDDLVNSYHLLLCCLDLVFGNALLCSNRKDLINPTFRGLPALYRADGHVSADEPPPCVLERLCELHDGLVVEAKGIKQHYFKPYIQKLYQKQILKGNEEKDLLVTPVSSATQSVSRLQSMVAGLRAAPSENLLHIFKNPTESIQSRVKTLGQTFKEHYTNDSEDMPGSHIENRLKLAEILYYKILENVMVQETKRLQGKDMSVLLEQDIFHCSLMACCLEVVLFSYSSQRTFPWIINIFKLTPFYFFKVIEVFIRSEEGLSRDMVKHLNLIEEQVLESRAWSADSALWSVLQAAGNKVPTVEEVNFSSSLDSGSGSTSGDVPPSPLSVHDRYSSPAAGSAKRRLFGDDPPARTPGVVPIGSPMTSPAKRLTYGSSGTLRIGPQGAPATVLSFPLQGLNNDRTITLIPVQPCDSSGTITAQSSSLSDRISTLAVCGVFLHLWILLSRVSLQVYHLASVRLRDLCVRLDVSSELRGKIWTCFEHALVHCTGLMRDRHIDQLLLCSVYIVSKITKEAVTFHDIMKCYRSQPQASSHVYRSVLLRCTPMEQMFGFFFLINHLKQVIRVRVRVSTAAEKPNPVSGEANSDQSGEEERGDLIQFYNNVYVLKMKGFALRYATHDNRTDAPPLSPFPSVRAQPLSPRRVSQRHSLYVSPHKNSAGCLTPNSYTYRINSSPCFSLDQLQREQHLSLELSQERNK
ncbi:hypothetical protein FQN60_009720 [Etheostoma spectabile]|uniref:Retinoblastoma-associated protein A-box domain-containing protein n=1 Tax=Etheostoma spectabile TaxID=54343 RepID=A0A5J5DJU4_9PERO|nr:hypothetical protein FQN60_009720 [Etheostoma spectabile]